MKFIKTVPQEYLSYGGEKRTREVLRPTRAGYILAAIVVVVLYFFMFIFRTIQPGEVGVMTRFGNINREVQPGVALKLPWPIERLHKFDVKTAKEEVKTQAGTKDSQILNSQIAVNYHIDRGSAGKVYAQLGDKYLETVLMPRVQTLYKNQTPNYTWDELLRNRGNIEANTLLAIQKEFDPQGIKIEQFSVVDFGFSTEVSQAIEDKQVAQQEAQKAVYVAEKAVQEAKADIERARGQAEAQRLLTVTASDKSIELKQLEVQLAAINKWKGDMPTTFLGGGNFLFNIPIK